MHVKGALEFGMGASLYTGIYELVVEGVGVGVGFTINVSFLANQHDGGGNRAITSLDASKAHADAFAQSSAEPMQTLTDACESFSSGLRPRRNILDKKKYP